MAPSKPTGSDLGDNSSTQADISIRKLVHYYLLKYRFSEVYSCWKWPQTNASYRHFDFAFPRTASRCNC